MKKTLCVLLSALVVLGAFALFGAHAETKISDKTMRAYTSKTFTVKKPSSIAYRCKVKYNEANLIGASFKDNGSYYSLKITAKKPADKKLPVVKVYYKTKSKKIVVVNCLRIKVNPVGTVKFGSVNVNVKTSKDFTIKNPFIREYELKVSDPKIVKLAFKSQENKNRTYTVKALKKGAAEISVYLQSTKKKVGTFVINSGDFPTKINPDYKTVKLKYNSHGSSTYMTLSHININDLLTDTHRNASYYAITDNDSIASTVNSSIVYATGIGKTNAVVYEKRGGKTKTVGKIKVKCVAAVMAYVVKQNNLFYEQSIFGYGDNTVFLHTDENPSTALRPLINERLLNNSYTGSSFKASDCKITYVSSKPAIAQVNSTGTVTAKAQGAAIIHIALTFADKSVFKCRCNIICE